MRRFFGNCTVETMRITEWIINLMKAKSTAGVMNYFPPISLHYLKKYSFYITFVIYFKLAALTFF